MYNPADVETFIFAGCYETMTLHYIFQGLSMMACNWITPPGEGFKSHTRVSITNSLKRHEVLEEFIIWYFNSFLIPLLKTTFYITESSAYCNHIMYFRHDDWEALCKSFMKTLTTKTYEKISKVSNKKFNLETA